MKVPDLTFVIPTYRLRDVAETVDAYDEHFWRNGHDVRIVVFDDGTLANRDKYYALLEANATYNPVYYVGPHEKERLPLACGHARFATSSSAPSSRACSVRATAGIAIAR